MKDALNDRVSKGDREDNAVPSSVKRETGKLRRIVS